MHVVRCSHGARRGGGLVGESLGGILSLYNEMKWLNGGALDGGSPCRMSILRNGNVIFLSLIFPNVTYHFKGRLC